MLSPHGTVSIPCTSNGLERLHQVCLQIIDVFDAHRQPNSVLWNARLCQLLR